MKRKEIKKELLVHQLKHNGLSIAEVAMLNGVSSQHVIKEIQRNGYSGVKELRKMCN